MTLNVSDVLCLTFSSPAPIRQALFLAETLGADLHVLPLPSSSGTPLEQDTLSSGIEHASNESGSKVTTTIPDVDVSGPVDILRYVDEVEIDLVVMETQSPDEPVAASSDSLSSFLINRLNVPIFFVGPDKSPASIDRLLVPTDFSAHSLDALHYATALAEVYDVPIEILHVIDSIPYVALTRTDRLSLGPTSLSEHRGRRQIRAFLREGGVSEISTRARVTHGDPARQIDTVAQQEEGILLVMSSHGTANQPQRPLGQIAERVLAQTSGPVFLVRSFGRSLLEQARDA